MRKRSKYRPKPVVRDTLAYVKENLTPITCHENYLIDLKIRNSASMVALLRGEATKLDLDNLIAMSNITEVLQRMGFGKEYEDVTVNGRTAILNIVHRAVTTKRFVPTGPQIKDLNLLMELHDAQMEVITVKDMENALKLATNLLRSGRATKLPAVSVSSP